MSQPLILAIAQILPGKQAKLTAVLKFTNSRRTGRRRFVTQIFVRDVQCLRV